MVMCVCVYVIVYNLCYAIIQFNSIQFKKFLIIPQGAILLWSWRARKKKLREQYNKHNITNKRDLL